MQASSEVAHPRTRAVELENDQRYFTVEKCIQLVYGVVALGLQIYIVYDAIAMHILYKQSLYLLGVADGGGGGGVESNALGFQTAAIVVSICLLPLFVYCILFKVTNLANDCEMVRRFDDGTCSVALNRPNSDRYGCFRLFLPLSAFLHWSSTYLLLIAMLVLQGEAVSTGVVSSDAVWTSDLMFIFNVANVRSAAFNSSAQTQWQSQSPGAMSPLFELHISVEFVSFLLALLALACAYSTIFLRSSARFSCLLFAYSFLTGVYIFFDYPAACVLYKLQLVSKSTTFLCPAVYTIVSTAICLLSSVLALQIVVAIGYSQYRQVAALSAKAATKRKRTRLADPAVISVLICTAVLIALRVPVICDYSTAFSLSNYALFVPPIVFFALQVVALLLLLLLLFYDGSDLQVAFAWRVFLAPKRSSRLDTSATNGGYQHEYPDVDQHQLVSQSQSQSQAAGRYLVPPPVTVSHISAAPTQDATLSPVYRDRMELLDKTSHMSPPISSIQPNGGVLLYQSASDSSDGSQQNSNTQSTLGILRRQPSHRANRVTFQDEVRQHGVQWSSPGSDSTLQNTSDGSAAVYMHVRPQPVATQYATRRSLLLPAQPQTIDTISYGDALPQPAAAAAAADMYLFSAV